MATTQELTDRIEALEKAMAEVHASFKAPKPSKSESTSKPTATKPKG